MGRCAFVFWETICLFLAAVFGLLYVPAGIIIALVGTLALAWRFFSSVGRCERP